MNIIADPMGSFRKTDPVKYLITSEQDSAWGLTVNSLGFQQIGKHSPYPPQDHPPRYLFSTAKGRILEEYQLLYIVQGRGYLATRHHKRQVVREGRMFLLFPGQWHTYYPDPECGWSEYWIGFDGVNIDQKKEGGFLPLKNFCMTWGYSSRRSNFTKALSKSHGSRMRATSKCSPA